MLLRSLIHTCMLKGLLIVSCRQKMQTEKLTIDDGLMMRQLVDFPGGLELHIGVSHGCFTSASWSSIGHGSSVAPAAA